ncbi:sensor histidine kinase [Rhodophyticola sp. CCM32]|uniref:sensor histidine kinase n=1 Tax=Rhodophyticola sp. CCM32 TaxID=2916397 RepID=UPI00107F6B2C|nr:ATP-binding protein [Rhodophyticola sp. CCM32]QBY00309.1 sensor histidine kinase [Rhodophyticola sp. CCM32]
MQHFREWGVLIVFVIAVALATFATWVVSHLYFISEEIQRAEARLSLYRSTVLAEVERFEHLTLVLSVDPFVLEALVSAPTDALNRRLAAFTEAAGLDAIFLMQSDGETIAASNAGQPGSFLGENYSFRPYFQQALAGGHGTFYGIGATTGLPGYFIADPVRGPAGNVIGVVALKISLAPFEQSWRDAGEQVFLANRQDVVLLASDAGWRYSSLDPLSEEERARIADTRQFTGQALDMLDWSVDAENTRARIDGEERLHLVSDALPHGWRLHYLAPDDRAVTRASLASGSVVVLAVLALLIAQYQRGQRLGAALRRSEEEEKALRRANTALAREIEERRHAERCLEETREELDRASRLAALGQLSASVTHELGQPIAAMRNHLTAAEMTGRNGDLTGVIGGLVDRMEGITRQLKFFARSDGDAFEDIDLRDCVAAVLDLMAPNIEAGDVQVTYEPPDQPPVIRGARLRIEQVLTNLIRNALDAMEDVEAQELSICLGQDDTAIWAEIADTGHGLGDATLTELREPFVTTRASGQGMGLGLAISSGILEDHGGRLEARNGAGGGAVFRVILPRPEIRELAAQ